MNKAYFKRALRSKHPNKPPHRLPRQLYPERAEANYHRELQSIVDFVKSKVDERIKPLLPKLVEHYGRERKDEDGPDKYYAAFIFDKTTDANVLHCTHHYLGALDAGQLLDVEKVIDAYFISQPKIPSVIFNRVEYFGEKKDIRVLTPIVSNPDQFFPRLKDALEQFRPDDFKPYKPHVTTSSEVAIAKPFSHYALISKRGIARTWPKTVKTDADDDLQTLADELEQVRIEVTQEYTPEELKKLAKLTGRSVEEFNHAQMAGQLKSLIEIDPFGGEPWLEREMGAFIVQNVSLIESISDEYLGQVEKMVATSIRSGLRVEEIAADLEDRYDVSSSRAQLIARDQVGKFNGQLTEARQKDLGIEGYIRRGVGDARERDSHLILNNESFTWDSPPEVGHPGEDIQCRCWAEPDLSQFYDDES